MANREGKFGLSMCAAFFSCERNIVSAPQSTAATRAGRRWESKRHLFVVDSLDKQIQNEKELIRLASSEMFALFLLVAPYAQE